ncbi:hypothetical protein QR680_000347 [Steinernema hermaphroditum]|uniref:Uncharacterized protein n=1 Tax=Steinernema hermaphroditum TaxID=289476 RepID=A0AA39LDF9_9BILA|nr:hypothetical protein QR680_000347 [Steinernema hermaphroditum]
MTNVCPICRKKILEKPPINWTLKCAVEALMRQTVSNSGCMSCRKFIDTSNRKPFYCSTNWNDMVQFSCSSCYTNNHLKGSFVEVEFDDGLLKPAVLRVVEQLKQ